MVELIITIGLFGLGLYVAFYLFVFACAALGAVLAAIGIAIAWPFILLGNLADWIHEKMKERKHE